jgi:hypothetical protein
MPVDIGSIKRNDQIAGAAAVLAFIFALIPGARTAEAKGGGASDSVNLWHGIGVLAALLIIVGIAGLAVAILQVSELQSIPVRWIATAALGLATLLTLIYIFTYKGDTSGVPPGMDIDEFVDFSAGWAGYLLVLLGIVATVFAGLSAQESGEALSGRKTPAGPEATPPPAA